MNITYITPCLHCDGDLESIRGKRPKQFHPHCKKVNDAVRRLEKVQGEWLEIVEGQETPTEGQKKAATWMRSWLMSLANQANSLGRKRIRSDRDRAAFWNSRAGKAAALKVAS